MPVFVWKGRTLAGEAQAGEIEVARAEEALEVLRKKRILVTSVRPKGGGFDEILMRLATYIEKADALKRKIQSAMVYPAVVLTVAMGATAFMLIFIIPTFAKMFTDFGGELPMPTRIVLALSAFLKAFWWAMLLLLVGAGGALRR